MIRYPGSKEKISQRILGHFPYQVFYELYGQNKVEYREPFFGSGAIGFEVVRGLPSACRVWLNDKDYGIACLWKAVHEDPLTLSRLVEEFVPTTDAFYRFKEEDGRVDIDPTIVGFRKLVLHMTSFSGLGARAGGPIGGRNQSSAYNVNCRWSPTRLLRHIADRHKILRRFKDLTITSGDFGKMLTDAEPNCFVYCDPPYYEKGGQLYKYNMSPEDHERLAALLRATRGTWVLSYDEHPVIRQLYSWAKFHDVELTYTTAIATNGNRRKNHEVIITP